jgi:hypothetical protein
MPIRDDFKILLTRALLNNRGRRQKAVYEVFDHYDWKVDDEEVCYAADKAGFQRGWVHYHTGPRMEQSREKHRQYEAMMAQARAAQDAQSSSYQQARYAQAEAQQNARAQQARVEEHLRSQFEWLFRAGMREAQEASNGCPGYLEPKVRRFGLTWPYTAAELKRAYRKKCMETHPDKGGTSEAFNEVQKDNTELERYAQGAA